MKIKFKKDLPTHSLAKLIGVIKGPARFYQHRTKGRIPRTGEVYCFKYFLFF